jgi:RNA polymerase sigma-70 factor (ECF subfamily)
MAAAARDLHIFKEGKRKSRAILQQTISGRRSRIERAQMTEDHDVAQPTTKLSIASSRQRIGNSPSDRRSVSDARLVEEARRGDKEAFGELVTRYERRLIRVILRFVPDVEQARDLAQETFFRVYRRLDQFDPARRFGPWMFRIGVNLTLDYLRKRKRRLRWSLFSDAPSETAPDPETPDPRTQLDLSQEVRAVMELLPEKYRSVLILRDLENFTTSEIAAILNRKEATIRWRLAEARKQFKTLWVARTGGSPLAMPSSSTDSEENSEQDD